MRRWAPLLAVLGALAGCGGSGGSRPVLTVSAAASLQGAFTRYAAGYRAATVRLSFGGSDILAAQIRQGVKPDVFAAANTTIPAQLYGEHLVERPVVFAANRLVLAVPARSSIRSLSDVERPGVRLAAGSPTVPVGIYTGKVLSRLPPPAERLILRNVRSLEPDVSGIVGKLTEGAVDAGFTYITDVSAAGGQLRAIPLPAGLQPQVAYAVAIVRGTSHRAAAERFIAGLLRGPGREYLRQAGFLPPQR